MVKTSYRLSSDTSGSWWAASVHRLSSTCGKSFVCFGFDPASVHSPIKGQWPYRPAANLNLKSGLEQCGCSTLPVVHEIFISHAPSSFYCICNGLSGYEWPQRSF